jgi:hypothetical protein
MRDFASERLRTAGIADPHFDQRWRSLACSHTRARRETHSSQTMVAPSICPFWPEPNRANQPSPFSCKDWLNDKTVFINQAKLYKLRGNVYTAG